MPLPDFTSLVEPLRFPINGHTFETYGPAIGDWLLILRIEAGTATAEETEGADLYRLALGPLYDEMAAANVPWKAMEHAALACAAYARTHSHTVAEAVWVHGNDAAAIKAQLEPDVAAPAPVKAPAKSRARKPAAR